MQFQQSVVFLKVLKVVRGLRPKDNKNTNIFFIDRVRSDRTVKHQGIYPDHNKSPL